MNPLKWKWTFLEGWVLSIAAGGVAGLVFGWLISPFARVRGGGGTMFLAYLHYPNAWWPSVVVAAVTAGLVYYAAGLVTGAN